MAKKTSKKNNVKLNFIEVFAITSNPKNPRTVNVKAESFKDLVDSITASGVMVPIHVRTHPGAPGHYELLAGSRRVAAAQVAELKQIPAIDHGELSDVEAFEITFAENFAREDLTPIEEGKAATMLLAEYKGDARAAASKFGKSVTWLRTHAAIDEGLIDEIQGHLAEYPAAPWTASHLALIARLPQRIQKSIANDYFGMYPACIEDMPTVADLEADIANDMRTMSSATWQLDEKFPKLPTCTGCLDRTGIQPELVDIDPDTPDTAQANDKCMDEKCWKAKAAASMKHKVAELKKEHPDLVLISIGNIGPTEREEMRDRCGGAGSFLEKGHYKIATKTTAGVLPAMTLNGAKSGTIKYITLDKCISKASSTSPSNNSASRPPAKPKTLAERRKLHESKRWQQVLRKMCVAVEESSFDQIFRAGNAKSVLQGVLKMAVTFGTENAHGDWDDFLEIVDGSDDGLLEKLWAMIRPVMVGDLTYNGPITQVPENKIEDAKKAAQILSIDIDALYADEVKNIPEPKAWAGLNANRTPKAKQKKESKAKKKGASK